MYIISIFLIFFFLFFYGPTDGIMVYFVVSVLRCGYG